MSYKFDEEVIHDREAMWNLALMFKCNYEFVKNQVEGIEIKNNDCIIVDGKVVMKWDAEFKPAFIKYKEALTYMNELLEFEMRMDNNKLDKYLMKV